MPVEVALPQIAGPVPSVQLESNASTPPAVSEIFILAASALEARVVAGVALLRPIAKRTVSLLTDFTWTLESLAVPAVMVPKLAEALESQVLSLLQVPAIVKVILDPIVTSTVAVPAPVAASADGGLKKEK